MTTQAERFGEILKTLKPNLTESDRKEAIETLGYHYNTVYTYLSGQGTNIETALILIQFFKKRIAERDRIAFGELPLESKPEEISPG